MLDFLGAPQNVFFSAAIVLMLLIGAVQLVGLGMDFDADADPHIDGDLLSWLGVGRLPLLMLLVVFLAIFGIVGLVGQQVVHDATATLLSPWIAVPVAAVVALPLTGLAANGLARVIPHDHTTAIPIEDLAGRAARIVTGRAEQGSPARARVEDRHGQTHYVMVEPDNPGQRFEEGETVLLVRIENGLFRAITRGDHHLPRLD